MVEISQWIAKNHIVESVRRVQHPDLPDLYQRREDLLEMLFHVEMLLDQKLRARWGLESAIVDDGGLERWPLSASTTGPTTKKTRRQYHALSSRSRR